MTSREPPLISEGVRADVFFLIDLVDIARPLDTPSIRSELCKETTALLDQGQATSPGAHAEYRAQFQQHAQSNRTTVKASESFRDIMLAFEANGMDGVGRLLDNTKEGEETH